MRKYILASVSLLALIGDANAQTAANAQVVSSCGTPQSTYTAGTIRPITQDTTGASCSSSSGGGGGAVTIANGADITQGTINDTHTAGTVVGFLKDIWTAVTTGPVPISAASLPLPTGAMQQTGGTVGIVAGSAVIGHVINDASSAVIGHVINDTGSTTAVTGNVTVVQPTASSLQATALPGASATTNGASTITTGGTFQQLAAAASARLSVEFQNKTASDSCYLFFGPSGETTAKSVKISAGQDYLRSQGAIPSDRIAATCDTNGDVFYFATQ